MASRAFTGAALLLLIGLAGCGDSAPAWAKANPIQPLPQPPTGSQADYTALKFPVTPERVRLGRLLFFDQRLSADGTISCATCHRPENAFSEPTPVSTGIDGQKGGRKAPAVVNLAYSLYPFFFWDGRAASLAEQAKGPMENPIEMGNTHAVVVETLQGIPGYAAAFTEAFGDATIDIDRVADAIAAYEATRHSANSLYDRWKATRDDSLVTAQIKQGDELFHGKARCAECHVTWLFTDGTFHNLGIGYDEATGEFADIGRYKISNDEKDKGAFKTPTVRDVALHAPYMHDGSIATLKEVVEHYNKGGIKNPQLDGKMTPLELTPEEVDAVVAFMEALTGEGYQDTPPTVFPE